MTKSQHAGLALAGAAFLLSACSAAGAGSGLVSASGKPDGQARFEWTTNGGSTAQLAAILPDGERFEGPAISLSHKTEPGAGFIFTPGKKKPAFLIPTSGKTWIGEIEATLSGDRGRTMVCKLREKKPGLGLEGGAAGSCDVSDGRRIAANF